MADDGLIPDNDNRTLEQQIEDIIDLRDRSLCAGFEMSAQIAHDRLFELAKESTTPYLDSTIAEATEHTQAEAEEREFQEMEVAAELGDLATHIIEYRDSPIPAEVDAVFQGVEELKNLHEELNRRIEHMIDEPDPSDTAALEEAARRWELTTEAGRQAYRQYDRYEQEALRHLHAELEAEVTTSETPYLDQLIAEVTERTQAEAREREPQEIEVAAVPLFAWGANAVAKAYQAYQKVPEGIRRRVQTLGGQLRNEGVEPAGEEPEFLPIPEEGGGDPDYTRPANARILDREQAGAPENSDMPSVIRDPEAEVTPTQGTTSSPSTTGGSTNTGGITRQEPGQNTQNYQEMRIEQLRQNRQTPPPAQETPEAPSEIEELLGNNPEVQKSVEQIDLGDSATGAEVREDGQAAPITPRARPRDWDDFER